MLNIDDLLARVLAQLPRFEQNAAALDRDVVFPEHDVDWLRKAGVLQAVLPRAQGGLGLGTEAEGAPGVLRLLRMLGRGHLALGRLFEAHVNALKLVASYGDAAEQARTAQDVTDGHLFGLWVTDDDADPVRLQDGALFGRKAICSGAGHCTRALITATAGQEPPRMLIATLDHTRTEPAGLALPGVRAATSNAVVFAGSAAGRLVGQPGDYLRQPVFSAGAWRTSAVTLGGLDALLHHARHHLLARKRDGNPHQQSRIGQALIAQETASLWMQRTARIAEGDGNAGDIVAYVNLARLAVERACLETITLVQRGLGLSAFAPGPVERIMRDLSVYLRQPAPDETLTEAAAYTMAQGMPDWTEPAP